MNFAAHEIQQDCGKMISCDLCEQRAGCKREPALHEGILTQRRMERVRKRVIILSNKGGVGKSTIASHLALALAKEQLSVGLLDLDLSGPSLPVLFGLEACRVRSDASGILPVEVLPNLKMMSLAFMLESADSPIMWRDSFKRQVLNHVSSGVAWGALDILLVDMPPGTGGELIAIRELVSDIHGAILVTTPHHVALADVRRAAAALEELSIPALGIIENMAQLECPHCGGSIYPFQHPSASISAHGLALPLLGRVPLDPINIEVSDPEQRLPAIGASVSLRSIAKQLRELLDI